MRESIKRISSTRDSLHNNASASYLNTPSYVGLMQVNSTSRSKTLKEDGIDERFIINSTQIILKREIGAGSFGSVVLGEYFGYKTSFLMILYSTDYVE